MLCALDLACSGDNTLVPTAPPTLTSVVADAGVQGTTATVILTATNFASGATISVNGGGVTRPTLTGANIVAGETTVEYSINQITGALTAIGTVPTEVAPSALATDPQGKFLYVTNQARNTISI